jgi:hypothetical protein
MSSSSSSSSSSSDYHDSLEDELTTCELQRLYKSSGNTSPLWTKEPDLIGIILATQAIIHRAKRTE